MNHLVDIKQPLTLTSQFWQERHIYHMFMEAEMGAMHRSQHGIPVIKDDLVSAASEW